MKITNWEDYDSLEEELAIKESRRKTNKKKEKGYEKNEETKRNKKTASYGVITLVGFNLFTGCVKLEPNYLPEYTIQFQIGLPLDSNGNYHLSLDRTRC